MTLIYVAQRLTGLKKTTGEFDWGSVPLESLEKTSSR